MDNLVCSRSKVLSPGTWGGGLYELIIKPTDVINSGVREAQPSNGKQSLVARF